MSIEENKELVRRFFTPPDEKFIRQALKTENPIAVLTERTRKDFETLLTPDFKVHSMGGEANFDLYLQINTMMCIGIPDVSFQIDHMVAEGDYVALYFTTRGTHEGPIMGPQGTLQETGNKINYDGAYFCRCDKGKIAEAWACFDTLTEFQQFGMIPKQ